jgi:thymidylate synthase
MRVLRGRNVNALFYEGMHLLDEEGVSEDSRAGAVMVVPWPVMSVYEQPTERVLFDAKRDANPFFHLMEGLWMLAGRNDSKFLDRYVKDFGSRFAESASGRSGAEASGVIHDAYGRRWRSALGFDQLDAIVKKLQSNPGDRQCVLQMWDARAVSADLEDAEDDLLGDWRTRPCNTHAYFRVRRSSHDGPVRTDDGLISVLDMTICCRSNDAVWGAHGANAVHFSMMQEYVAGRVGVAVGKLYQFSNNYHGYADTLAKVGDPMMLEGDDPYENGEVHAVAMGTDWETWDEDLRRFMTWHDGHIDDGRVPDFANEWFATVAVPVASCSFYRKLSEDVARRVITECRAPDWRRACVEWMDRRAK